MGGRLFSGFSAVRRDSVSSSIVALTGLAFEARIARCPSIVFDGIRTPALLQQAIAAGARGIISFGVCGALSPHLSAGQWVVASSVFAGKDHLTTHDGWFRQLVAALPGCNTGPIVGLGGPPMSSLERSELHSRTGAIAVDMESHVAARTAAAHGLPFASCRVVVNAAHRRLPPAALLDFGPGGTIDSQAVFWSILKEPRQLPDLFRLAIDASLAFSALRKGRSRMGPALSFAEFS